MIFCRCASQQVGAEAAQGLGFVMSFRGSGDVAVTTPAGSDTNAMVSMLLPLLTNHRGWAMVGTAPECEVICQGSITTVLSVPVVFRNSTINGLMLDCALQAVRLLVGRGSGYEVGCQGFVGVPSDCMHCSFPAQQEGQ